MSKDLSTQRFPDFSDNGAISPDKVNDSPWGRLRPLLSAQELKDEYLFGIPLWSFFPDPVTGKRQHMTDATLARIIEKSVARVEELSGCLIAPSYCKESYPFDLGEYRSWGFVKLNVRPVTAVVKVVITAADRTQLFEAPIQWVALANLVKGQLALMPMGTAGAVLASASGQPPFLLYLAQMGWVPQFWQIETVAGFKDMLLPTFVADLIGITAALDVLSQLGATYAWMTGGSLGIDGLSQSTSGPGPAVFQGRMAELKELQQKLIKKFKKFCGLSLVSGSV